MKFENLLPHDLANRMAGLADLDGWLHPEWAAEMAELILKTRPTVVVEIGVFGGRSLLAQAMALDFNGHGKVYGIDPWKTAAAVEGWTPEHESHRDWWARVDLEKIHASCMAAIWRENLDTRAIVIRARSEDCFELFHRRPIDILFIDGNHSEEAAMRDVRNYLPSVRYGGYIWFDDCSSTTLPALSWIGEACDLVLDRHKYRLYQKRWPAAGSMPVDLVREDR